MIKGVNFIDCRTIIVYQINLALSDSYNLQFICLTANCRRRNILITKGYFIALIICHLYQTPNIPFSFRLFERVLAIYFSRVVRKPVFAHAKNEGADQLRVNNVADQRLCFRYIDSTIPVLPKSQISSFMPSSVVVKHGS